MTCYFIVFIFAIFGIGTVMADREISEIENRKLTQLPEVTLEAIKTGSYTEDFTNYIKDQFPARENWIKTYFNYQMAVGRTFIYNYYINEDHVIVPKPSRASFDKENEKAIANLVKFAEVANEKSDVYFFSLPHKVHMIDIDIPGDNERYNSNNTREEFLKKVDTAHVKVVNVGKKVKQKYSQQEIEDMYFKTDHHWNLDGALAGYDVIVEELELVEPATVQKNTFEEVCYDKPFRGSYNVQLYNLVDASGEKVCHINPNNEVYKGYQIFIDGQNAELTSIYGRDLTGDYLSYNRLFTMDYRELRIINPLMLEQNEKVLVLKDSYTNAIAFHLAQHFYETTIIDLRHQKDRTTTDLIKENHYDKILIMYNDTNLKGELYNF